MTELKNRWNLKLSIIGGSADGENCKDDIITWDDETNTWNDAGKMAVNQCALIAVGTVEMTPELQKYC